MESNPWEINQGENIMVNESFQAPKPVQQPNPKPSNRNDKKDQQSQDSKQRMAAGKHSETNRLDDFDSKSDEFIK